MSAPAILSWSSQKVIDLAQSQFARPISLPDGWQKVRVGVTVFKSVAGALAGTPRFAVGIQKGTTNLAGDPTTDYWVGAITTGANWNDSAGFEFGIQVSSGSKNGNTWVYSGTPIDTDRRMLSPAYTSASMWIVDITAGSPNYTVNVFTPRFGVQENTSNDFLTCMAQITPTWQFNNYGTDQPVAAASEAAAGHRDAVSIWWDRTDAHLYIADLAVALVK